MPSNGLNRLLPPVGEEGPSFPTLKKSLSAVSSRRNRSQTSNHTPSISKEPSQDSDATEESSDTTKHGRKDPSLFLDIPTLPKASEAALTALKYLPIPVIVLSSQKMVLLANEAMGRLLGLDSMDQDGDESDHEDSERAQSLDLLRGQRLSQIGIDVFEDGQAVCVNWEASSAAIDSGNDY